MGDREEERRSPRRGDVGGGEGRGAEADGVGEKRGRPEGAGGAAREAGPGGSKRAKGQRTTTSEDRRPEQGSGGEAEEAGDGAAARAGGEGRRRPEQEQGGGSGAEEADEGAAARASGEGWRTGSWASLAAAANTAATAATETLRRAAAGLGSAWQRLRGKRAREDEAGEERRKRPRTGDG